MRFSCATWFSQIVFKTSSAGSNCFLRASHLRVAWSISKWHFFRSIRFFWLLELRHSKLRWSFRVCMDIVSGLAISNNFWIVWRFNALDAAKARSWQGPKMVFPAGIVRGQDPTCIPWYDRACQISGLVLSTIRSLRCIYIIWWWWKVTLQWNVHNAHFATISKTRFQTNTPTLLEWLAGNKYLGGWNWHPSISNDWFDHDHWAREQSVFCTIFGVRDIAILFDKANVWNFLLRFQTAYSFNWHKSLIILELSYVCTNNTPFYAVFISNSHFTLFL